MEQFPIRSLQQAMEPDELESSHALQVPEAQSPADIFTIFDQITYDKVVIGVESCAIAVKHHALSR